MATKLTRPVRRETPAKDPCYGRPLMVELDGHVLRIWQKGRRRKLVVAFPDVWRFAFQAYVRALAEEKRQARKARKGGRR